MLKNFVSIILLICIAAQSPLVAALSVHDKHHDGNTTVHDYFHDVGQPHEHDEIDLEKFEISYSKQALEHSDIYHDGGVVGVVIFAPTGIPKILPEANLDNFVAWWASPFIKRNTPPPKI
ncbi:MAG: hypothetical protein ACI88A_002961 [Paraglaciecola sp.]|jgi:hypothetical protein